MEELLYQYNPWWEAKFNYEGIIERPEYTVRLQRHFDAKMVVFLTGLRRVGKTTLMKLLIGSLIKRGIEGKYILYVSVDDYLLMRRTLFEILDEFRKIHKIRIDERMYLFF